jgi:hypothetical protein
MEHWPRIKKFEYKDMVRYYIMAAGAGMFFLLKYNEAGEGIEADYFIWILLGVVIWAFFLRRSYIEIDGDYLVLPTHTRYGFSKCHRGDLVERQLKEVGSDKAWQMEYSFRKKSLGITHILSGEVKSKNFNSPREAEEFKQIFLEIPLPRKSKIAQEQNSRRKIQMIIILIMAGLVLGLLDYF